LSLSLRFPHQHPVHPFLLPHTRHMPCPSHSLDLTTRTILGKEYRSFSFLINMFYLFFVPEFLRTTKQCFGDLWWNTANFCSATSTDHIHMLQTEACSLLYNSN
jgi:hypothetical protein